MSPEKDLKPLVSVILTTRDRPRLLDIALQCYACQTYANRELIVVDDGDKYPVKHGAVEKLGGRILRVEPGMLLGTKLNYGVAEANGLWCQKMDDDDWYAPGFVQAMMVAIERQRETVCRPLVAILAPFLFFDVSRWEIRRSAKHNAPGATLLFAREDWEQRPFRAVPQDEDVWFVRDQRRAGLEIVRVRALETFLAVRHSGSTRDRGHTWTHQGDGNILEDALRDRPLHARRPEDLLPQWALSVYRPLHEELAATIPHEHGIGVD
jgi:glycosyltransferase involved in cell wall biosynthesis